ncbi:MAG TPA: hypothetical protein VGP63_10410 [Planctomycetaceae bacterium]|nr:hypothetical protein [Planctomycetaceae bacterium]
MNAEPANPKTDGSTDAGFRPAAALAFWCSLLIAAGLFAVLALAPKLRTYHQLSRDYQGLHRQLVSTERRTESLAKVADALQHDPDFASELARINFDASKTEERIPVGPQLSLAAWDSESTVDADVRPSPAALLDGPLLNTLSDDRAVRVPLFAASSLLVVVAFALCGQNAANRWREAERPRIGIRGWLADRYRKPRSEYPPGE